MVDTAVSVLTGDTPLPKISWWLSSDMVLSWNALDNLDSVMGILAGRIGSPAADLCAIHQPGYAYMLYCFGQLNDQYIHMSGSWPFPETTVEAGWEKCVIESCSICLKNAIERVMPMQTSFDEESILYALANMLYIKGCAVLFKAAKGLVFYLEDPNPLEYPVWNSDLSRPGLCRIAGIQDLAVGH